MEPPSSWQKSLPCSAVVVGLVECDVVAVVVCEDEAEVVTVVLVVAVVVWLELTVVVCELVGVEDRSFSAAIAVLVSVVPSASVTVTGPTDDSSVNATSAVKMYTVLTTDEVSRRLPVSVHPKLTSGISFRVTVPVPMTAVTTAVMIAVASSVPRSPQ